MNSLSRLMTSAAAVGGLVLLFASSDLAAEPAAPPAVRVASLSGSIQGVVQDENGVPVKGAVVWALGATTTFDVTDGSGRFALRTLSPGAYLVRAHSNGFIASPGKIVDVRPSGRASSSIALRHATTPSPEVPVLVAGIGSSGPASSGPAEAPTPPPNAPDSTPGATSGATSGNDDHGEIAWRLRHLRRGILQELTEPDALVADESPTPDTSVFGPSNSGFLGSPARL